MNKFVCGVLTLLVFLVIIWICQSSMEPFEDVKMRPWFGYEPGYGPGWGRKGCCNTASPESISANNLG
jgi:hypothetical protein